MPREATDLRERILHAAGELFIQQGYASTSIKQIAQAAGCKTASLYYYFEGGKPDILRTVVEQQGFALFQMIEQSCSSAQSLEEFLTCLGENIHAMSPEMERRMVWLELEAPHLAGEQRRLLASQIGRVHGMLRETLPRFLGQSEATDALAWVIFCAIFGFQEIAIHNGGLNIVPLSMTQFTRTLAGILQPPS